MSVTANFTIQSPSDIFRKLIYLQKQRCLLSITSELSNESYLSAIIDIDKDKKRLIIDCSPSNQLNEALLKSYKSHFHTEIAGIKVEFTQQNITKIYHKNRYYFSLPLPDSLVWIENREFYRIRSPLSQPATCQIQFPEKDNLIYTLSIFDISLSGLAITLETPDKKTAHLILKRQILNDSLISLPNIGDYTCSLEIRNHRPLNPDKPNKIHLIGTQFSNISPAIESKIQRYIQLIERENRKKS